MYGADLKAMLLRQGGQQTFVHRLAHHQHRRHGHAQVVLRQKRLQHLRLGALRCVRGTLVVQQHGGLFHMHRKVRPVAQVPPAAHHGQIHTRLAALHFHGQDVHIPVRHVVHRLLVQDIGQRRHLVAQFCGLLKLQAFGVRHHARLQGLQHLLRIALQKALGVAHVLRIVRRADVAHARPGAALDLVEQTGTRAVAEDRVFASAQAKNFLH